jgi:nitrate/nitrite transport system substrate-binding protein
MTFVPSNGVSGVPLTPPGVPVTSSSVTAGGRGGAPEIADLRFGFLPLTDAAPLLVAMAKGYFAAEGLQAQAVRLSSWTASRDALQDGTIHVAQMLYGMPVASRLGILGHDAAPLVVPWILSRGGQAITLAKRHAGVVGSDARALYRLAVERRDAGRPLVFAQTLPPGTHAMWLRYWLAEGGIDPDRDVALITIPPPMMVKNLAGGRLDGFCAGEPWNAIAQQNGAGFTAVTSDCVWPGHPEKVCAVREDFAERHPLTVKAVLRALLAAGRWCDDPANASELAALLSAPEHLDCAVDMVKSRLQTGFDLGDGRIAGAGAVPRFSGPGMHVPQAGECLWFLSQYRRWGFVAGVPDYHAITASILRPDLCREALAEAGVAAGDHAPATPSGPPGLESGDPEAYAQSFAIKSVRP